MSHNLFYMQSTTPPPCIPSPHPPHHFPSQWSVKRSADAAQYKRLSEFVTVMVCETYVKILTPYEWSVLQGVAVCCSVLQCAAVCCSVLQCVAVRCSARDKSMKS